MNAGLAAAIVTLVREPAEDELLRRALRLLARFDLPLFVCDGGSGPDFVGFLQSLPRTMVVEPIEKGLIGQVRASIASARDSGAEFVLYTESDKAEFFDRRLSRFLRDALLEDDPGVVLAARSDAAFATFPPSQQFTEGTINRLCGEFLGTKGDYSYGPFLVHRDVSVHVDRAAKDLGWGWRHMIFAIAHRLGTRIVHLDDDHTCPEDQRVEDDGERLHRLRQLGQNVQGLLAGLTMEL
ncbi:MAG TPA: hypothetical protein VGD94_16515 [Vicinamibacterales bacterium]